jgi:hypothetical protein
MEGYQTPRSFSDSEKNGGHGETKRSQEEANDKVKKSGSLIVNVSNPDGKIQKYELDRITPGGRVFVKKPLLDTKSEDDGTILEARPEFVHIKEAIKKEVDRMVEVSDNESGVSISQIYIFRILSISLLMLLVTMMEKK